MRDFNYYENRLTQEIDENKKLSEELRLEREKSTQLLEQANKLASALEAQRYGCDDPQCFCDVSIGNPMMSGHSQSCDLANSTLASRTAFREGQLK